MEIEFYTSEEQNLKTLSFLLVIEILLTAILFFTLVPRRHHYGFIRHIWNYQHLVYPLMIIFSIIFIPLMSFICIAEKKWAYLVNMLFYVIMPVLFCIYLKDKPLSQGLTMATTLIVSFIYFLVVRNSVENRIEQLIAGGKYERQRQFSQIQIKDWEKQFEDNGK